MLLLLRFFSAADAAYGHQKGMIGSNPITVLVLTHEHKINLNRTNSRILRCHHVDCEAQDSLSLGPKET